MRFLKKILIINLIILLLIYVLQYLSVFLPASTNIVIAFTIIAMGLYLINNFQVIKFHLKDRQLSYLLLIIMLTSALFILLNVFLVLKTPFIYSQGIGDHSQKEILVVSNQKTYTQEFTSRANYLGIVELFFRPNVQVGNEVPESVSNEVRESDIFHFKLIDKDTNRQVIERDFRLLFAGDSEVIYPIGFPQILDSQDQTYIIQLTYDGEDESLGIAVEDGGELVGGLKHVINLSIASKNPSELIDYSVLNLQRIDYSDIKMVIRLMCFLLLLSIILKFSNWQVDKIFTIIISLLILGIFGRYLFAQDIDSDFLKFYLYTLITALFLFSYLRGYWKRLVTELLSQNTTCEISKKMSSLGLAITLSAFTLLVFWNGRLGRNIGGDELHIFNTAIGYLKTGEFVQWNWITDMGFRLYDRSKPLTLLTAFIFKSFGIHELLARVPYFVFGLLSIISVYYVTWKIFQSRYFGLILSVFFATNLFLVFQSTIIRGYIILFFTTLWLLYFLFRAFYDPAGLKKFLSWFIFWSLLILSSTIDLHLLILAPLGLILFSIDFKKQVWRRLKFVQKIIVLGVVIFIILFLANFQDRILINKLLEYINLPPVLRLGFSETSFLNISLFPALIIIAMFYLLRRNAPSKKMDKGVVFFGWLFLYLHIVLIFFLRPLPGLGIQTRYLIPIIVVNFYVLLLTFDFFITLIVEYVRKKSKFSSVYIQPLLLVFVLIVNIHLSIHPFLYYHSKAIFESEYNYWDMYTLDETTPGRALPNHAIASSLISNAISQSTILVDYGLLYENYYYRDLPLAHTNYYFPCIGQNSSLINMQTICKDEEQLSLRSLRSFLYNNNDKDIIIAWLRRKEYGIPEEIRDYIRNHEGIIDLVGDELIDEVNYRIYKIPKI